MTLRFFHPISFPEAPILKDSNHPRLDFHRSLACGLFWGGARARFMNSDCKSSLQSSMTENARDLGRRWLSLKIRLSYITEMFTVLSPYQISFPAKIIMPMKLHLSNLKRVARQESSRYSIAIRQPKTEIGNRSCTFGTRLRREVIHK